MARLFQIVLIVSTVGLSWLAMTAVHELGHVLSAWLSGGVVTRVVLHPLEFSRTDVSPNPHPLRVAWGGPMWGTLVPLAVYVAVRFAARPYAYLAAFLAGFCLIANGAYLAVDSFFPAGDDAGVILHHGGAQWQLVGFGVPCVAAGLYLFDGLGSKFGLGSAAGKVDRRAAVGVAIGSLSVAVVEVLFCR